LTISIVTSLGLSTGRVGSGWLGQFGSRFFPYFVGRVRSNCVVYVGHRGWYRIRMLY